MRLRDLCRNSVKLFNINNTENTVENTIVGTERDEYYTFWLRSGICKFDVVFDEIICRYFQKSFQQNLQIKIYQSFYVRITF